MGVLDGSHASKAVLAGQILGIACHYREFYDGSQICFYTPMPIEKVSYIFGYIVFIVGFSSLFFGFLKRTERLIQQNMEFSSKRIFRTSVEQFLIQVFVGIQEIHILTLAWGLMKDEAKCIRFNDCERGFNQMIADLKLNVCDVPIGSDGLPIQTDANICEEIFNGIPLILTTCLSAALYIFRNNFEMNDVRALTVIVNNGVGVTRNPRPINQGKKKEPNPKPMTTYSLGRSNAEGILEYDDGTIPICQFCKSPFKCSCFRGTRLPSETYEVPKNSDSDSDSSDKENEAHSSPTMKPVVGAEFPPWGIICFVCGTTFKCSCKKSLKDNKGDNRGEKRRKKPAASDPKLSKTGTQKPKEKVPSRSLKDVKNSKPGGKGKKWDDGKSRSDNVGEQQPKKPKAGNPKVSKTGTQKPKETAPPTLKDVKSSKSRAKGKKSDDGKSRSDNVGEKPRKKPVPGDPKVSKTGTQKPDETAPSPTLKDIRNSQSKGKGKQSEGGNSKSDNVGENHPNKSVDGGPIVSKTSTQKPKETAPLPTLILKDMNKSSKSKENSKKSNGRKSRSSSPKKNSTRSSESKTGPSTKENEAGTPKKGRGGPKKQTLSKTPKTGKKSELEFEKKTDSTTSSESNAGSSDIEYETETPKKGRGKPKKQTPSKTPKTGKKSELEFEKKTDSTSSSESNAGSSDKEYETDPPKRGPGRPKKKMPL